MDSLPVSRIDGLYESESFKAWKQAREQSLKLPAMILGRIDSVAKQVRELGNALKR